MRRILAAAGLAGLFVVLAPEAAFAHAALVESDPPGGATLETAPTTVRLTFSEAPQPSLSSIRVLGPQGAVQGARPAQPAPGGGPILEVGLPPLAPGTYTVVWRTVSRVDGHPTAGVFAFGVGVAPEAAGAPPAPASSAPWTELIGRGALIAGLIGLLGSAGAAVAGFGPATGGRLAFGSWGVSLFGLVFLVDGQRRNSAATLSELWATPTGRSLAWRAVAIAAAGVALALARRMGRSGGGSGRVAMAFVALAAAAAMAVEVAAGHAAGASPPRLNIAAQWAHFAAAGVWLGGLAALLTETRGAPSEVKAAAVRRFSQLALVALLVVVATGAARALAEVSSWDQLAGSGYGRAVLVKIVLVAAVVGLAAANRRFGVPRAAHDLSLLRRVSAGEIVLACGALVAAVALTSIAPPVEAGTGGREARVSGANFATSVRATLTVRPASPGFNSFVVGVADYDTGDAVPVDAVSLRFVAVDDPGLPPTTLELRPGRGGAWVGSGGNLSVDGRWQVTVQARRNTDAIVVDLAVDVAGPPQFLSVQALPGEPVKYTVGLAAGGYARIWADPQHAGASVVHAAFFDANGDPRPVDHVVLTTTPAHRATRQHATKPAGTGEFTAEVTFPPGRTSVAVVARTRDATRMRASVDLEVAE